VLVPTTASVPFTSWVIEFLNSPVLTGHFFLASFSTKIQALFSILSKSMFSSFSSFFNNLSKFSI